MTPLVTRVPLVGRWRQLARPLLSAGLYLACSCFVWWHIWTAAAALTFAAIGLSPVIISGPSMAPALQPGDVVFVDREVDWSDLHNGEVIVYTNPAAPDQLVTHRIKYVNDDGTLTTQGDANALMDSDPVTAEQLFGQPRWIAVGAGSAVLWYQNGDWMPLIIWLGAFATTVSIGCRPVNLGSDRGRVDDGAEHSYVAADADADAAPRHSASSDDTPAT